MKKYLLPKDGSFYKANLHCHSTISDGRLSLEEIKQLYKANGYSVVAFTDHDVFLPHHDLTDEGFLALSGFEAEFNENSQYPGNRNLKTCHLCFIAKSPDMKIQPCWNKRYAYVGNAGNYMPEIDESEPEFVREYTPECINKMIGKAREEGFFVTYNHPAWSLENYEQYTKYEGLCAMEIFNYSCDRLGYPSYATNVYDDMLRTGKRIFAICADDTHDRNPIGDPRCDACGGYVMIKADELKYEKITDALFNGNFYASTGPEIYDLYIEDNKIHITCSDASKIILNTGHRASKALFAKPGEVVNEAVFEFNEDDVYLRITVVDKNGNFADTNAYFLEG